MPYKIKINEASLLPDGRVDCEYQVLKDGKVIDTIRKKFAYIDDADPAHETPEGRIAAFRSRLNSIAQAYADADARAEARKVTAESDLTPTEVQKLVGYEYETKAG